MDNDKYEVNDDNEFMYRTPMEINLNPDVREFLESNKELLGMCSAIRVEKEYKKYLEDCESPIEQLFCIAILTMSIINNLDRREFKIESHDISIISGIYVMPQCEIGKYRVDFVLGYGGAIINIGKLGKASEKQIKELVVELDGHKFHDRNEKQRRYEKNRDRFLQKNGYEVFHYTGSEIVKNPYKAALECVLYLTGKKREELWWATEGTYGVPDID